MTQKIALNMNFLFLKIVWILIIPLYSRTLIFQSLIKSLNSHGLFNSIKQNSTQVDYSSHNQLV